MTRGLPDVAAVAHVIRTTIRNHEGEETTDMAAARAVLEMFDPRYTYGTYIRHDAVVVPYRRDALATDPDEELRFHAFPAECGCAPPNTDDREYVCEHGARWTRRAYEPYGTPE